MSNESKKQEFVQAALDYHQFPKPGKIALEITKPTADQKDLALAYSPGVAEPVKAIAEDPENAYKYTAKGNLVGVITNGSAILGLGNLGSLASKPVMEGKGILFKRFADIDVFDIEVNADTTEEFIKVVESIAPTFGGINLEDIAAPECFEIERVLEEKLDIPVFHDDQHGTAIIIAAGLMNALELAGKNLETAKIVCLGAGAAGIASMEVLASLGAQKDNLFMLDRGGVIHSGRDDLNKYKQEWAVETDQRTLRDACTGADVFIGLSGPNLLDIDSLDAMAADPIVFALSNPDPEINPAIAKTARPDVIIGTGRSDYPNQVNNVLGFPFIFRGALDVRATHINAEMKMAEVLKAYGKTSMEFGRDYIIPTPLDTRLQERLPAAISQAAIDSGVARINKD